jgi:hypothetical protein
MNRAALEVPVCSEQRSIDRSRRNTHHDVVCEPRGHDGRARYHAMQIETARQARNALAASTATIAVALIDR